ncbi:MAG: acyltransferase family protein [Roseobacter sp.]
MRAIAVLLLVAYHVIGSDTASGLQIGYPHMPRLYADFFLDVRMPFFAFIAGYVYALRPPSFESIGSFWWHKLRRLAVPGVVATASFMVVSAVVGTRFAVPIEDVWRPFVQSYAHYWFLQAILVIFVVYGLIDAVLGGRFSPLFLIISCAVFLSGASFPGSYFSAHSAIYLLPFFLLGVVFCRFAAEIWEEAERLTILLFVLALICAFWNIRELLENGTFSLHNRDAQSLAFGLAVCSLAFLWCPRLTILERLSPYAFTIYLYHVFGTVAARILGDAAGLNAAEPRFLLGLMGGVLVPVALHKFAQRQRHLGKLVLGR